ncbi:MAG: ABC transporter permease [Clostridiales bacterium]|nr:ABC transporter permease [Clostridiales bacterium]
MLKKIMQFFRMLRECFVMSVSNILGSRMRSFLTILGILIGVAAVIALITTVSGFSGSLSDSFSSMGAGTLTVSVTGSELKEGLSSADLDSLTALDCVRGVTPTVSLKARVSRGDAYESSISVSGRNTFYFRENSEMVSRGRIITPVDENNMSYICLITTEMMETFFFGVDPLGETLYISGIPFQVVGILADDATESLTSLINGSSDIIVPYTTAMRLNNVNVVTSFTVYLADGFDSETGTTLIEEELDRMFSFEEDCFTVTNMSGVEDTMESMLNMVSALLAGIASIALVVGGIGIMNMMLTTVTERTVEIGLKKALGALPWQIQVQFLMESFMLSMISGILGIFIGLILSYALCTMMETSFVISMGAIALGAGFSAAVGIIFGWAPARKASNLNPIDALRSM